MAHNWNKQAWLEFAKLNLVRSSVKKGNEEKFFRMLEGGLPYPDILGFGRLPHCFVTGLSSELCLMLQCSPRALDFFDRDEKEVMEEKKKAKLNELESKFGYGHIPQEELVALEASLQKMSVASGNKNGKDSGDGDGDDESDGDGESKAEAGPENDANAEVKSGAAPEEDKEERFKKKRLAYHARIRNCAEMRKERGELCMKFRKIHHQLSKIDPKKTTADEGLALILQHIHDIQEYLKAAKSRQLEKLFEQQFSLSFWDWKAEKINGDPSQSSKVFLPEFIKRLAEWVEQLNVDEDDGTFKVFPLLFNKMAQELTTEVKRSQKFGHIYSAPPLIRTIPRLISKTALAIALKGEPELGIKSMIQRGFGPQVTRDFLDDWRFCQFKDRNGLFMATDYVPLLAYASDKNQFFQEFQVCLSRIMYCDEHKFEPRLVEEIAPTLLSALATGLLKEKGEVDMDKFDIYPMLYYSVLELVQFLYKEKNAALFNSMYTNVMRFVHSRARYGKTVKNLAGFLCKAAICGIPWAYIREPFMREFLIRAIRDHKMHENATPHDYKRHIEIHCMPTLRMYLLLLCFDGGQMNLADKLNMFRSNRGALPAEQRRIVCESVKEIFGRVKTLDDVFLLMGLAPIDATDPEIKMLVLRSIRWAMQKQAKPYVDSESDIQIVPEKLESLMQCPVSNQSIATFWATRKAKVTAKLSDMSKKHEAIPKACNFAGGRLPDRVCASCGAEFASKQELFRNHLDLVLGKLNDPSNALYGRHTSHYALNANHFKKVEEGKKKTWICNANRCSFKAESEAELFKHFLILGVPGKWGVLEDDDKKVQENKDQEKEDYDLDECIVCFAAQVQTQFIPCGHAKLCTGCAESIHKKQGSCPYCRTMITKVVVVEL